MIKRKANARWEGELRTGSGNVKLGSGAYDGPYSFGTRFEQAAGTNPEELLGAAYAACFSMALNAALSNAGHAPEYISTATEVRMDKVNDKMTIVEIVVSTVGAVPGISKEEFAKYAEETKAGCIVSRALASVPKTLDATLV